jgi:hypothetical protein
VDEAWVPHSGLCPGSPGSCEAGGSASSSSSLEPPSVVGPDPDPLALAFCALESQTLVP